MRCVAQFCISHYLAFAWLFECMLMLFSTFMLLYLFAWVSMAFWWVYHMSNVRITLKWVNTSILTTFEWWFLISKYHENCNAISSFTVLCHVPWNTYLQCSAMISLVCYGFIYCWLCFCSDAVGNKHSFLKLQ